MRIELSRTGDYAVRAVIALAADRGLVTAAVIAERTGIPRAYVPQVMGPLIRAGLVANRRGRAGGYCLAGEPSEITLLSVIKAVEGDLRRRTCVLRGGPCGRSDRECSVHDAFARAQMAATEALGNASIADVAHRRP
jgi:Rrf2 family transcriptional regulator, iron-sulfur cluster assembly transcription factor